MGLMARIARKAICPDIEATERDDALREVLAGLVTHGYIESDDSEAVMQSLLQREALGSTAIGKGIAVPHGKSGKKSSKKIIIGIARSLKGVRFRSLDGEPVHVMFLVVSPLERPPDYLAVMEGISRTLQNQDFMRFMMKAGDAKDILEIIEEMC